MKDKFKVIIIGAGNIGALYDKPESNLVLTHAHAYSMHEGFELLGFIDADLKKALYAADKWGGRAYKDISEVLQGNNVDVISICTPDAYHYELLRAAIELNVKFVFVEKPLATDSDKANELINIYEQSHIRIGINYSRRYVPEFIELKDRIQSGEFGEYITGGCYYGKGISHNGSHAIDMLRFFAGEINHTETITYCHDFYNDDPTITGVIYLDNNKTFFLHGIDSRFYSVFEMDFLFSKKRIRIYDSGFRYEVYDVCQSNIFSGYMDLMYKEEVITKLGSSIYYAVDNIYQSLQRNDAVKCTIMDGYEAIRVCEALKAGITL